MMQSRVGSFAESDCQVCKGSSYSDTSGTTAEDEDLSCKDCPVGRFLVPNAAPTAAEHDDLADCDLCPKGRFNDDTRQLECKRCTNAERVHPDQKAGTGLDDPIEGAVSEDECKRCPSGKYNSYKFGEATAQQTISSGSNGCSENEYCTHREEGVQCGSSCCKENRWRTGTCVWLFRRVCRRCCRPVSVLTNRFLSIRLWS